MKTSRHGFTLIELLVAVSIFVFMAGFLVTLSGQAASLWSHNQSQSRLREQARTALEFIGNELSQAVMPLDRASNTGPQLVINPSGISADFLHRDAIFWMAPIATSTAKGKLAAVGYFIRKDGNAYNLCRFFINPDDANYNPGAGISDALLDTVAPADKSGNYKGLFLRNVPGLWIAAYDENGALYTPDSRTDRKLPTRIDISLAFLDDSGAARVGGGTVQLPATGEAKDVKEYLEKIPGSVRNSVGSATISVMLQNRR